MRKLKINGITVAFELSEWWSDDISCLYLGIVYDWADSHVSVSMEKGFHTECDVSTTTGLEWGEKRYLFNVAVIYVIKLWTALYCLHVF